MTAHKVNQAASDRSAMKDFMKDLEEDDDEEEMQEWIREQKEKNKSEADIAEDEYNSKMEKFRVEAIAEAEKEAEYEMMKAMQRTEIAKKKAAVEEKKQIDKVYAVYAKAMREGDFKKVYDMIEKVGISVNWEDTYGNTAIISAAKFGLKVPIDRLLYLGADVNQENSFGRTPLIEGE